MAWIALVRHGVTDWNLRGIIQGRTDIPLSEIGIKKLRETKLCDEFLRAKWTTSPLQRAMQTAAILNPNVAAEVHRELIETNWGKLEGTPRAELPKRIFELRLTPDHGLDFCPPDGESARMVRRRLLAWLASANTVTGTVAVTHKGVIRAVLSAACDWDMRDEFRPKPEWSLPHIFGFDGDGKLRLLRLNCPWDESPIATKM